MVAPIVSCQVRHLNRTQMHSDLQATTKHLQCVIWNKSYVWTNSVPVRAGPGPKMQDAVKKLI